VKAETLDRLVTIQRLVLRPSRSGHPTEVWSAVAHRRAASVAPLSGREAYAGRNEDAAPQALAQETVVVRVRWAPSVADLTPQDRIVYPAPASPNEQAPPARSIYDIVAVSEIGRRDGLKIVATRRNEATPVLEVAP